MSAWKLEILDWFERSYKHIEKRYPKETTAMLINLDKYLNTLNQGVNVAQIKAGFIHPEQKGVISLDQSGAKCKPTQTRLYIYPDENTRTVFLITIEEKGNKKFQQQIVQDCCEFVKSIKGESNNG